MRLRHAAEVSALAHQREAASSHALLPAMSVSVVGFPKTDKGKRGGGGVGAGDGVDHLRLHLLLRAWEFTF